MRATARIGGARQRERVKIQMDRARRAKRRLPRRKQEMGADKTILDNGNQVLLQEYIASLVERLPDIDVTNAPPGMNAPADDTSTPSGR